MEIQFLTVLGKNLFYLVEEGDFDHVFSVFNYLNQYIPLAGRAGKVIDAEAIEKSRLAMEAILSDDTIFYEFAFIPILYQIILDFIKSKPDSAQRGKYLQNFSKVPT